MRLLRRAAACGAALPVLLALAAPSQAASVHLTDAPDVHRAPSRLVIVAAPGEVNRILVTKREDGVSVIDFGSTPLQIGDGCVPAVTNSVHCPTDDLVDVRVRLDDGDDAFRARGPMTVRVAGGAGDDVVHGGPYRDELSGGPGDDELFGGGGPDVLDDGSGDDLLDGGPSDDRFRVGSGADEVAAGDGDDLIRLADREGQRRDAVGCGRGADRVVQPKLPDVLDRDCEQVALGTGALAFASPFVGRGRASLPIRCVKVRVASRCSGTARIAGRSARFAMRGGAARGILIRLPRRAKRPFTIVLRGERRTVRRTRGVAPRLSLSASWRSA